MFTRVTHRTKIRHVVLATVAPLIVALGLAAGFAPAAHAQFTDTFSSSPDPYFNNASGTYSVSGGTYQSTLGTNGSGSNFLISTLQASGYSNLTAFTYQIDLLNAQDSGLIFRSDASGLNSDLVVFRTSDGAFYFIPFANGTPQNPVAQTNLAANTYTGQNMRVTLSATATTYTASIALLSSPTTVIATIFATNQNFVTAGDTAPSASGAVGVYQFGNAASASHFDNVVVTAAPEPTALLLLAPGALGLVAARRRRTAI